MLQSPTVEFHGVGNNCLCRFHGKESNLTAKPYNQNVSQPYQRLLTHPVWLAILIQKLKHWVHIHWPGKTGNYRQIFWKLGSTERLRQFIISFINPIKWNKLVLNRIWFLSVFNHKLQGIWLRHELTLTSQFKLKGIQAAKNDTEVWINATGNTSYYKQIAHQAALFHEKMCSPHHLWLGNFNLYSCLALSSLYLILKP